MLCAAAGCGGTSSSGAGRHAERGERAVAEHFASALLHGRPEQARALLADPEEEALVALVRRAVDESPGWHPTIEPARQTAGRWSIRYGRRRSFAGGRFATERGTLLVLVGPSKRSPARVTFFAFTGVERTYSTHQDAELLPSKR
jgi:hypothetical protein